MIPVITSQKKLRPKKGNDLPQLNKDALKQMTYTVIIADEALWDSVKSSVYTSRCDYSH